MSRADMFGRKFVAEISALCMDELWENGGYHQGDLRGMACSGQGILRNQEPSGANPTEIFVCTCKCHKQKKRSPRDRT